MLQAGADKVSINTAAVQNPSLVREAAERFGSQCVVVAVDAERRTGGGWEVFTHGGRTPTGRDAVDWCRYVETLGAGEILLDEHGSRRNRGGVRPRAHPGRSECDHGPGDRIGGGRNARAPVEASQSVVPMPYWPRPSSTSALIQ